MIKKIEIKNLLSRSTIDFEINGLRYLDFIWFTRGGMSTGIMIKLPNNNVITIGTKEYKKSSEIIEYIKTVGIVDKSLKRTYWTKINKTFVISGLIVIVGFILSRLLE
jgi:hypothetical protein